MTKDEFIALNPIIMKGENGCGFRRQDYLIQGEFLKTHTFIFDALDDRMVEILKLRCGLHDGRSWRLQEIADKLDISRERIRQLERNAFDELSRPHRIRLLMEYTDSTFDRQTTSDFIIGFKSLIRQDIVQHISQQALKLIEDISIDELTFKHYGPNKDATINQVKQILIDNGITTCKDIIEYLQLNGDFGKLGLHPAACKVVIYAVCDLIDGKRAEVSTQEIFDGYVDYKDEALTRKKQAYIELIEKEKQARAERLKKAVAHPENVTLEDLGFRKHIYDYLKIAQINTLADLIDYCIGNSKISTINLIGEQSEMVITSKLKELGINLDQSLLTERKQGLEEPDKVLIEILNLQLRTYNALKRQGINTIDQLIQFYFDNNKSLRDISSIGVKCEAEILDKLAELGIDLQAIHSV